MSDLSSVEKIYQFYEEYVKEAISGVQAITNDIPMEFLLEIYSAFDDLKYLYVPNKNETEVINEVISHLKRATLDCYKTQLVLFNDEIENFEKKYDLTLLDNGKYYPRFSAMKHDIHKLASKARSLSPSATTDEEFDIWKTIYILISEFRQKMIADYRENAMWSRRKQILWQSILLALVLGVAGNFLYGFIKDIFCF